MQSGMKNISVANVENADEVAEKLCQFVYDLKMDFKKQEDTK